MSSLGILLNGLLAVICLPAAIYLLLLTVAAARGAARRQEKPAESVVGRVAGASRFSGTLVIVVPAHNEADGIMATLDSLLPLVQADGAARLLVVADNCSDDTAAVARAAGAEVLERHDPARRGKGYALEFAFTALAEQAMDAVVVIDADTVASINLLPSIRSALGGGAQALQVSYLAASVAAPTPLSQLQALALCAFNHLRPLGRQGLGWSVGIHGNGFVLTRQTLAQVPYTATSLVEDLEYHHALVAAGIRVHYLDQATVFGVMPQGGAGRQTQRSRWEGGRLRLLRQRLLPLLGQALTGKWRLLEPALELALLPLAWHFLLLCAWLVVAGLTDSVWSVGLALAGLLGLAAHVLLAARMSGLRLPHLPRLLLAVLAHLGWKLRLLPTIVAAASQRATWLRTERDPEPANGSGKPRQAA